METELERTAREYAVAVRRSRTASGLPAAGRRERVAAVADAHGKMMRAALAERPAPDRVPPEPVLQQAAGECVRAVAREAAGGEEQDGALTVGEAFHVLHLAAMAAYDPDPDAPLPAGMRAPPPGAGGTAKLGETIAWAKDVRGRDPERGTAEAEDAAFLEELQRRWREAMAEVVSARAATRRGLAGA